MGNRSCLIPLGAGLVTFAAALCLFLVLGTAAGILPFGQGFKLALPVTLPTRSTGYSPTLVPVEAGQPARGAIQRSSLLELALLSVRRVEDKANMATVITTLQVSSVSEQPVDLSGLLLQFRLLDPNGAEYGPDVFNPAPNSLKFPIQNLARGTIKPLPPGAVLEGDVYFQLPRSVTAAIFQWWPSPFEPRFRFPIALH